MCARYTPPPGARRGATVSRRTHVGAPVEPPRVHTLGTKSAGRRGRCGAAHSGGRSRCQNTVTYPIYRPSGSAIGFPAGHTVAGDPSTLDGRAVGPLRSSKTIRHSTTSTNALTPVTWQRPSGPSRRAPREGPCGIAGADGGNRPPATPRCPSPTPPPPRSRGPGTCPLPRK